ncbi:MAG: DUF1707 SHOCT-like domain-containing protein [Candidatus Dormibacteria bacterium]
MSEPLRPGPPDTGPTSIIRASDRERDRLVERLSAAVADGRLDLADFSDRLEAALSAKTMADIQALEADLGQAVPAPVGVPRASGTSWFIGIMSSAVRRGRWVLQPRSHALAVMGECVIDLRGAEVAADYSHITATAVKGTVRVIVPEGIDVDVDGVAIMGAKTLKIGADRPLPGSPVIRVTAIALMGEVSVVSKPPKDQNLRSGGWEAVVERQLDRHMRRAERIQERALRHRHHWGGDDD